jgi:two-component system, NtrC family, response regulator GlrR
MDELNLQKAERPRILVVDDDDSLLTLIAMRLDASGFETTTARSASDALGRMQARRPQLVVLDLRLNDAAGKEAGRVAGEDDVDGLALFARMRALEPLLPVIILTAHGSIPDAIEATRNGVAAFITKPFDGRALVEEIRRQLLLRAPAAPSSGWRARIVTRNQAMLALVDEIERIAQHDATVLIQGPSGSGKELVAQSVHAASRRAGKPFVAVNCAALPEPLLESELFGHVKGAFSGAVNEHPGLLRTAQGGTLLLDEISDMPLALQAKLLRAVQERHVRPVGGAREIEIDVHLVAATHRDLALQVKEGRFREDLFYRLNVVRLTLPPLAARREDVSLLAQHFLRRLGDRYESPVKDFASEALQRLAQAPWPGNVRQLANVIEQCVVLADGPLIGPALVSRALAASATDSQTSGITPLAQARAQFERDYLVQLLKLTGGSISQAARLAGRNRTEFYRLIERHGLTSELFR